VIGVVLKWGARTGVISWGIGIILGAIAQASFVVFLMCRNIRADGVAISFVDSYSAIRKLTVLALPTLVGVGLLQINVLVTRVLAARLEPGSISALNYADMLILTVVSVFGTAFATVLLPHFSDSYTRGDWRALRSYLRRGLVYILVVILPLSIFFLLFSENIVLLIFQRGAFDERAAVLTAGALRMYVPALVARSFVGLLIAGFSACHDTRTPAFYAVVDVVVNISLALILMGSMGHLGLALASSMGWIIYAFFLFFLLNRQVKFIDFDFLALVVRIFFLVILAGICATVLFMTLHNTPLIMRSSIAICLGCAVYLLGLAKIKLFTYSIDTNRR
jgi:putative peptidoglycan lipid II flippase